jgi:hypothetical protein
MKQQGSRKDHCFDSEGQIKASRGRSNQDAAQEIAEQVDASAERTSDALQRASQKLSEAAELRESLTQIRVIPTPSSIPPTVLVTGADGVKRVRKDI